MDINPEDIDKVSVLKGAAATALYGARAANGVILITTKKGTKRNGLGVSVTSWIHGRFGEPRHLRALPETATVRGTDSTTVPIRLPDISTNGYMVAYDVDGDGIDDPCIPDHGRRLLRFGL